MHLAWQERLPLRIKYIGDASLLVFPQEDVDGTIRELPSMKRQIERYFESSYPDVSITFSAHVGQILIVRLEPLEDLDILGDSVARAFLLGNQARGGGFVISSEVYERLTDATRRHFHQGDTQAAYTAV